MLNDYLDYMSNTKPDFVTSWNVSFDINYLVARCIELKLEVDKLSPFFNSPYKTKLYGKLVSFRDGPGVYGKRFGVTEKQSHAEIKGLHYFDLLTAYKNITAKEAESFRLDNIAQKELGINSFLELNNK